MLKNRTAPRVQVFHNRLAEAGNFLAVELRGNGAGTNRDAIASVVHVEAGDLVQQRTLRAGEGFLAQSSKRLHFGLSSAESVERLRVRWPDGTESEFEGLQANQRVRIHQPEAEGQAARLETIQPQPADLASVANGACEPLPGRARRIVLGFELPIGPVRIPGFGEPDRRVVDLAGDVVLLNLWREDCAPCQKELGAFGRAADRLAELGVRVVPLTLDGAAAEEPALTNLRRLGFPTADSGYLDRPAMEVLMDAVYAHVHQPRNNLDFVTPTSFLLDAEGNLLVLYHGVVDIETLAADVREIRSDDPLPVLDRLRHGFRLVHHRRDLGELARALAALPEREDSALRAEDVVPLVEYYLGLDATTRGYILKDGERVPLRASE